MKGTSPYRGCGEVSANGNKSHDGISDISSTPRKGKSMSIITVGINLAKSVFAVHGVNDSQVGWATLHLPTLIFFEITGVRANL